MAKTTKSTQIGKYLRVQGWKCRKTAWLGEYRFIMGAYDVYVMFNRNKYPVVREEVVLQVNIKSDQHPEYPYFPYYFRGMRGMTFHTDDEAGLEKSIEWIAKQVHDLSCYATHENYDQVMKSLGYV
jgi:hypothetical protein